MSADDIVQETFIRAWRRLPELTADERPVRPWLFRVARNLVIDADRAARSRPVTIPGQPAEGGGPDAGLDQVLDRQLLAGALQRLSPTHRTVLVETFYGGSTLTALARKLEYLRAQSGHGCTTRCMRCGSTWKIRKRPRPDEGPPAQGSPDRC